MEDLAISALKGLYICFSLLAVSCAAISPIFSLRDMAAKYDRLQEATERTRELLGLLLLAGWVIIYFHALYGLLWFVPEDLGHLDEFGGWESVRFFLASVLAIYPALVTADKIGRMHETIRRQKMDIDSLRTQVESRE